MEAKKLLEVDDHDDYKVDEVLSVLSEQKGLVTYTIWVSLYFVLRSAEEDYEVS